MPALWWTAPVLALVVFVLAFPQAVMLPLLDRDEPRFAEASREMIQSGNYVVPTFNHQPRYAKPPLIYWCQVAAYQVFGENAFAARLPSLLAVAGTAVLLLAWGRALGSHAAGLIAALAYALCLQVMQQGRVATADALLIFFMTLTGFAGWRMLRIAREEDWGGPWHFWGVVLALGFGGGFLAKGPEALLPFLPLMISARGMGGKVLGAFTAILALGLLLVALWAVPAYVQTHGDYWREGLGHDVGDRMVTGFQGHGASTFGWYLLGLPLYLLTFWLSALPWSPLLAMRARTLRAAAPLDWTDRYLLGNAVLVFIVFSLMVTKLPHYTLPAFPFLTLLFGRRWIAADLPARAPLRLMIVVGLVMGILLGVIGRFCGPLGATPSPVGMLVLKAGAVLTPGTQVAMVDFREPNAVWEMRRVVRAPLDEISEDAAVAYMRQPGARAIILSRAAWARMHGLDVTWKIYEARGFNAARLKGLDLMLLIKPGSG
jgi:4-amino-4-deoxy-L-arabinose transferase-like glycosyltransferase